MWRFGYHSHIVCMDGGDICGGLGITHTVSTWVGETYVEVWVSFTHCLHGWRRHMWRFGYYSHTVCMGGGDIHVGLGTIHTLSSWVEETYVQVWVSFTHCLHGWRRHMWRFGYHSHTVFMGRGDICVGLGIIHTLSSWVEETYVEVWVSLTHCLLSLIHI